MIAIEKYYDTECRYLTNDLVASKSFSDYHLVLKLLGKGTPVLDFRHPDVNQMHMNYSFPSLAALTRSRPQLIVFCSET
jgi:hypothetical protein